MRSNFNKWLSVLALGAIWAMESTVFSAPAVAKDGPDPAAACRGNSESTAGAITYINPETLFEADSYSSGAIVSGGQRTAYISGQLPVTVSYDVRGEDLRGQARVVLHNLCEALAAANMTTEDVVRLGIYYVHKESRNPFEIAEEVIGFFRRDEMPATTMTAVPFIITENILIQMDAIAVSREPDQ